MEVLKLGLGFLERAVDMKFKKKDLPKQYNVWAKDQKSDDVIERSGDLGFVTFADACNWAFKEVPATYFIRITNTTNIGEITVFEVCLFGLKGELLYENRDSD